MIIVDNALAGARGRGTADPRRDDRRRFHGPGAREPDRQQRAGHGAGGDLRSPAETALPTSTATRDSKNVVEAIGGERVRGRHPCRPPGRRPTTLSALPVRADRRAGRRDRLGRVRRRVVLEAFEHGKSRGSDERGARRDDRPDPPGLRPEARRHLLRLRGRRAGRADEPVSLGQGLGLIPRVIGNVKGLQDPYRNPTTQQGLAEKWGQNPAMVTSFADGSKISFEQAIVANATGFKVRSAECRAASSSTGRSWKSPSLYDVEEVRELGGIVDYTVGPPGVKVFCLAEHADPKQRHYLEPVQDGRGPALSVLDPVSPSPLRGAERDRSRGAVRRQPRAAARAVQSSRCAPSPSET